MVGVKWKEYGLVFRALLAREFLITRRNVKGKLIDMNLLLFTTLIVWSYFIPQFKENTSMGPMLLVGSIATFGFFEVTEKIILLVEDLTGEKRITYTLLHPLPIWMVFSSMAISWCIESLLLALLFIPIGKLILWNQFIISDIHVVKTIVMYLILNLFYGYFGLCIASMLKQMSEASHIWIRVINPLFMFGSFFYTWKSLYAMSPGLGLVTLVNPVNYAVEGLRSAMLANSDSYLPFGLCCVVLIAFTIVCAFISVRLLRKRLDCI